MSYSNNNCSISATVFIIKSVFLLFPQQSRVRTHHSENCKSLTFDVSCYVGFPQFHEIYRALTSQPDYNVTLPMILSEWHKLYNISCFEVWINRLPAELGEVYWKNWMTHTAHNISGTLLQRFAQNKRTLHGRHVHAICCK